MDEKNNLSFKEQTQLIEENLKLKAAMNKVLIIAAGGKAYTSEFTTETQRILSEALDIKPSRWPY